MHRLLFLLIVAVVAPVQAASMNDVMMKLEPEERAHQACILRGIDTINRSKKLKGVDRLKTSILSRATFDGTTVVAKGGAVRADHQWYALKFTCAVGKDQLKATSFDYETGAPIPKTRYEDLGLWE